MIFHLNELQKQYTKILADYIEEQTERNLYIGQNFIRQLLQKNIAPEEVIHIHKSAVEEIIDDFPIALRHAYDFLIEVMVHYGLALSEHKSLLQQQEEMQLELQVATNIQNMILKSHVPKIDGVDVGMISVPARKMSGDYVHFIDDKNRYIGIAVADVVGKGIPAALCMSMVKYGMDSLDYSESEPERVLEVINRIVEKSVDDSMFVSMFYGRYDVETSTFAYGSAGHEPALHYKAASQTYEELGAKGLLLGILPDGNYEQHEVQLQQDDLVIMMTDGVTEIRTNLDMDAMAIITSIISTYQHEHAQKIVDEVFRQLEKMQNFELSDDFTLVILKKN